MHTDKVKKSRKFSIVLLNILLYQESREYHTCIFLCTLRHFCTLKKNIYKNLIKCSFMKSSKSHFFNYRNIDYVAMSMVFAIYVV